MQLILREDVENLGRKGDTVEVARGYARNYLLPKKLAMEVTENNIRHMEKEGRLHAAELLKEKEEAEKLAGQIETVRLVFRRKVHGEELYGSVSVTDIIEALEAKAFNLEKRKIVFDEPIRTLGEFSIPVKLHPEVTVPFTVVVEKEEV